MSIDGAFPDMLAAQTIDTNADPSYQRYRVLNCLLITSWMLSLLFSQQDTVSIVSKEDFKLGFIWRQNSFPFYMTFGPEKMAVLLDCVHMRLFLCTTQVYLAFVNLMANCVHRQWFLEVYLSPCRDVHTRNISVINAVPPEGLKITCIHFWLEPCPLHTNTPPGSLSHDGILKIFAILPWETFFWNCSIFFDSLSQMNEPLSIFTSEKLRFSEMLCLYSFMLLTCCQLT